MFNMTAKPDLSKSKTITPDAASGQAILTSCDVVRMGDGSFHVVPRRPQSKLTIKEAARVAHYSRDTIYRLFHAKFVVGERQSPRKILIDADSLQAHLEAVREPGFWTPERRQRYWGA